MAATQVTREMVHLRACELALGNGHAPGHISQADYEQARRDVTGERDRDRQEASFLPVPTEKSRPPS